VLCGPAGCGKSTFAARHFSRTEVISSDECRALVSDDPADQSASRDAFELMHFIIEKRLKRRCLTVADATHLQRDARRHLTRIARANAFNTAAVVFNVPLSVCLSRNRRRARAIPEDALARQHKMLGATLETVGKEGFDFLFFLDETTQSRVRIEVTRRTRRNPRSSAPRQ